MAEPLTDKELAEFRRRVDGLHDMSLGTSMRVGWERRILATIVALRDQLQQALQQRDIFVQALVAFKETGDELEAERDAAIEQAEAAEGMLDEAVRLLGQAEEADGWTTPNEFLRCAAKVLTPAEAQARQKEER